MTEEEARERAREWIRNWGIKEEELSRESLAALLLSVASEQRERDARVCEALAIKHASIATGHGVLSREIAAARDEAERCAAAIRAGGEG